MQEMQAMITHSLCGFITRMQRLMNTALAHPRAFAIIDPIVVGGCAIALAVIVLVLVARGAEARYIKDDGTVRQLYLCYFVADELGYENEKNRFLVNADYQARIAGWSNTDLAFYKGYTYGKYEDRLNRSLSELADTYKNLGCDLLVNRPIVTRDE
jgi:hypothetical protein